MSFIEVADQWRFPVSDLSQGVPPSSVLWICLGTDRKAQAAHVTTA
jgi:hypothetical protein